MTLQYFLKSVYQFAEYKNIPQKLDLKKLEILFKKPCQFCHNQEHKKTYQNVGLHNWKNGYTLRNCFPLCSICYKIRLGRNLSSVIKSINCILYRRPQIQYLKFNNIKMCQLYDNTKICKFHRCMYCGTTDCLTIDKIDPSSKYTMKNTQTLCFTCNRMKSNIKEHVFFKHIKKLVKH